MAGIQDTEIATTAELISSVYHYEKIDRAVDMECLGPSNDQAAAPTMGTTA